MGKRAGDHSKRACETEQGGKIYGILCSGISLREDDTGASTICSDS